MGLVFETHRFSLCPSHTTWNSTEPVNTQGSLHCIQPHTHTFLCHCIQPHTDIILCSGGVDAVFIVVGAGDYNFFHDPRDLRALRNLPGVKIVDCAVRFGAN